MSTNTLPAPADLHLLGDADPHVDCPTCGGSGEIADAVHDLRDLDPRECPQCQGHGSVPFVEPGTIPTCPSCWEPLPGGYLGHRCV